MADLERGAWQWERAPSSVRSIIWAFATHDSPRASYSADFIDSMNAAFGVDPSDVRRSAYSDGRRGLQQLVLGSLQRCVPEQAAEVMIELGTRAGETPASLALADALARKVGTLADPSAFREVAPALQVLSDMALGHMVTETGSAATAA